MSSAEDSHICEVWSHNLDEEFDKIRQLVNKYNYVALDTEYPGIVAHPFGEFFDEKDYTYQTIRCNVDLLNVIQIGVTLFDRRGRTPEGVGATTWQFNIHFDLKKDMFAVDAIDLLNKSGLELERMAIHGIDPFVFAELLTTSGLVLNDDCKWISFHGGYDFAYLLKLLTQDILPKTLDDFRQSLWLYFPVVFDIKFLMNRLNGFTGSLQDIVNKLNVRRLGRPHQAGSDSYVSGKVFFRLAELVSNKDIDVNAFVGQLYQLNTD